MNHRQQLVSELRAAGRFMMQHELAWGTSGNISARVDDQHFYISASSTFLGDLGEDDLIICPRSAAGEGRRPSKETPMHQAIYSERPDIQAVLHASPFYSTMLACTGLQLPSNRFIESMYYLERVERVRYEHPGSAQLAEAVREKAKKANVLLLENHGVVVYDVSVKEALSALQTLEFTAKMLFLSLAGNVPMRGLSEQTATDFLENAVYKPRRSWL